MRNFDRVNSHTLRIVALAGFGLLASGGQALAAGLIPTEFMIDPNSEWDADYEWIEIYNPNDYAIDLSGFVLDGSSFKNGYGFIEDGNSIDAGSTAVLYGSVVRDAQADWGANNLERFDELWGLENSSVNLIPIFYPECGNEIHKPFCAVSIKGKNGSGQFGLWSPDNWDGTKNYATADLEFNFKKINKGGQFPQSNNSSSVYLKDVSLDPSDPTNWALSTPGVAGAYAVDSNIVKNRPPNPGPYGLKDVGSPGYAPGQTTEAVPEPTLGFLSMGGLLLWLKRFKSKTVASK